MDAETSIKGFIEASFLDWPGRVASVVFLPSCNLRCPYCHNSALVLTPDDFEEISVDEVMSRVEENAGFVDGVVVTGGEPAVSAGLPGLLERFRLSGVPVKLDTNGTMPEVLERILENGLASAVAMDIKAPLTSGEYSRAAGREVDITAIKESIDLLLGARVEVFFRTTVVPCLHDDDAIRRILQEIPGHSLTFQNFRPEEALDPQYRKMLPFGAEDFERLKKNCF